MTDKKQKPYTPLDFTKDDWPPLLNCVTSEILKKFPDAVSADMRDEVLNVLKSYAEKLIHIADKQSFDMKNSGASGMKFLISSKARRQNEVITENVLNTGKAAFIECSQALHELGIEPQVARDLSGVATGEAMSAYDLYSYKGGTNVVPNVALETIFTPEQLKIDGNTPAQEK